MKTKFIHDQHQLTGVRGTYGPLGNVAANGCGSVALYNLYQLLGCPVAYEELLEEIGRGWFFRTMLAGLWGTSPWYVIRRLGKLKDVRLRYYWYRGRQRQEQKIGCHSFFLYLYIYPFGAHYTVGDARGSRLVVYNDTCRSGCLSGYYREVRALGMLVIGIEKIPFLSCAPAKKRL